MGRLNKPNKVTRGLLGCTPWLGAQGGTGSELSTRHKGLGQSNAGCQSWVNCNVTNGVHTKMYAIELSYKEGRITEPGCCHTTACPPVLPSVGKAPANHSPAGSWQVGRLPVRQRTGMAWAPSVRQPGLGTASGLGASWVTQATTMATPALFWS